MNDEGSNIPPTKLPIGKISTNPQKCRRDNIKTSESGTWEPHVGHKSPPRLLPNL